METKVTLLNGVVYKVVNNTLTEVRDLTERYTLLLEASKVNTELYMKDCSVDGINDTTQLKKWKLIHL